MEFYFIIQIDAWDQFNHDITLRPIIIGRYFNLTLIIYILITIKEALIIMNHQLSIRYIYYRRDRYGTEAADIQGIICFMVPRKVRLLTINYEYLM